MLTRNLNAFQHRHVRLIGAMLAFSVALTTGIPSLFGPTQFPSTAHFILGLFAVLPIIGTMVVLARYLSGEKDEYLRGLVVQSILWGFGLVMVADSLAGALVEFHPHHFPFGLFNMDLFVTASAIALRLKLWRDR